MVAVLVDRTVMADRCIAVSLTRSCIVVVDVACCDSDLPNCPCTVFVSSNPYVGIGIGSRE